MVLQSINVMGEKIVQLNLGYEYVDSNAGFRPSGGLFFTPSRVYNLKRVFSMKDFSQTCGRRGLLYPHIGKITVMQLLQNSCGINRNIYGLGIHLITNGAYKCKYLMLLVNKGYFHLPHHGQPLVGYGLRLLLCSLVGGELYHTGYLGNCIAGIIITVAGTC